MLRMPRGWLLGLHLIGVVLWMGGLLCFSRILGYHAKELPSARPRYTFLEGRLNWLVSVPGAVVTVGFGVWLAYQHGMQWFRVASWMHWKLTLVLLVVAIHAYLTVRHRRIVRQSPNDPLPRALFAALHGTIGLLMIAILLLATVQPMSHQ
jgi:putative membrane protein